MTTTEQIIVYVLLLCALERLARRARNYRVMDACRMELVWLAETFYVCEEATR